MKKFKMVMMMVFVLCTATTNSSVIASAEEISTKAEPCVSYSIEVGDDDEALVGATLISSNSYIENDRMITVTVYEDTDGTIITDTLSVSATAAYSKSGSDTVTRTRTLSDWGSITITATFEWYEDGLFSYVKCKSMRAYKSFRPQFSFSVWETSYTSEDVAIGTAKAQVKYAVNNTLAFASYKKGTFKITCSDTGKISDNG